MSDPPLLIGDPHARGRAFARLGAAQDAAVRRRVDDALQLARARDALPWIAAQWQAQQALLPEVARFVEGLAEGHGLATIDLVAAHLRYAVEDSAAPDPEGCSAVAVARPDGRALLAKNRDNPPMLASLQSLVLQSDPSWGGRRVLSVGSFGSAPSVSSGINSDGFCMADTAVRTRDIGTGALRYYLMEALLIRCADVPQAVTLLKRLPHLGGGTLAMADAAGRIAIAELGHSAVHVEEAAAPAWLARTNHFRAPALAAQLREASGSPPRRNSEGRLDRLQRNLSADYDTNAARALLSGHTTPDHPALCRHGDDAWTLSCAIFDPYARSLRLSLGQPCEAAWRDATCHA
jgi:hypothetical protein